MTDFFPTGAASTATLPAAFTGTKKLLSLSRGAGVQTQTDNTIASLSSAPGIGSTQCWGAATAAVSPRNGLLFVSKPLSAVTIGGAGSGVHSMNIRALESATAANYTVGFQLWRISADGLTATEVLGMRQTSGTELGTGEAATVITISDPTSAVVAAGEYLVAVFEWIAGGGTSASGRTASGFYAGAAGATGDTFVRFPETITELTVKPRSLIVSRQVPLLRAMLR